MDAHEQMRKALEKIVAEIKATHAVASQDYGLGQDTAALFFIKLDMLQGMATAGMETSDENEAGNSLEVILEELPSLVTYAEQAGLKPDFGGSGVHIKLDMIRGYAAEGLGDREHKDQWMHLRP